MSVDSNDGFSNEIIRLFKESGEPRHKELLAKLSGPLAISPRTFSALLNGTAHSPDARTLQAFVAGLNYERGARKLPLLGADTSIRLADLWAVEAERRLREKPVAARLRSAVFDTPAAVHELAPVVDFVHRDDYAKSILASLEKESPHETLVAGYWGMPGVGKTHLANYVAARLTNNYAEIQLRRDFRGYDEKPGLTTAQALWECLRSLGRLAGVETDDVDALRRIYVSALVGRKALVVLDDIADADAIRALLPPPGCALLFTSRDRFDFGGMHVEVKPPSPEQARAMFDRIAEGVEQSVAADICELCENLPLAVCAAAGFIATTPDCDPADYRDELLSADDPLDYLGKADVPRSVANSFTLSYKRLSPEHQRVLRELTVFAGDFSGEAEATICSDTNHEALSFLVRRALVFFNREAGRYRLHSLMQVFARAQPGIDKKGIHLRHAQYYLSRLRELADLAKGEGEEIRRTQDEFLRDWAQIAAAQKWCSGSEESGPDDQQKLLAFEFAGAAPSLIDLYLPASDRMQWFDAGLRWRRGDARIRAGILIRLSDAHQSHGNPARAVDCLRAARADAKAGADEELEIRAAAGVARLNVRDKQGYSPLWKSDVDELKTLSERAKVKYPELWVDILLWLAATYVQHVDRTEDDAIKMAKNSLRAAARLQPQQLQAVARAELTLGRAYLGRKRFVFASGWLRRGVAAGTECGNPKVVSLGYGDLAKLAGAKMDWVAAEEWAGKSLEVNRKFCGNRGAEAGALVLTGQALAERGDWITSGEHCVSGVTIALQSHQRNLAARGLHLLAQNPSVPEQLQTRLQHAGDQLRQRKLVRFDGREILKAVQLALDKQRAKSTLTPAKATAGFLGNGSSPT